MIANKDDLETRARVKSELQAYERLNKASPSPAHARKVRRLRLVLGVIDARLKKAGNAEHD